MNVLEAYTKLVEMNQPAFTTADAAAILGVSPGYASKIMARLADAGRVTRLMRGTWALENKVRKFALPQYVAAPFPCYVSLQSALYYHGMISQIPSMTYAVSLARTRRYDTALGVVSLHHVAPSFFFGFEPVGDQGGQIALPEKALLDVLYLGPAKTRLFTALPELELPDRFSVRRAREMVRRIPSKQRRTLVRERLKHLGVSINGVLPKSRWSRR